METLDLQQAADFLKVHPETLRQRAKSGIIPGCKVGRSWVFLTTELVDYMRSKYHGHMQVPQGEEKVVCNSRSAAKKVSGGIASPHQMESEYLDLLELPTSG